MVDTPIDHPRRIAAALPPYMAFGVRYGGGLGFFLILAPAIGPRGYGLFLLALSGVAVFAALPAKTATHVLAAMPDLDDRHWSTALVTLMIAGIVAGLTISGLAGAVAPMVDDPGFSDMFRSLAALPLLEALAAVPRAALHREGRTTALAVADATGLAAGGAVAVSLAWSGAGAWSLVAQVVIQRLVECIVLWGLPGARIGIAWSPRHFAGLLRAVDGPALAPSMPVLRRFGPCLAIGLVLGPTAAALYMLAAWLSEGTGEFLRASAPNLRTGDIPRYVYGVALPVVLTSAELTIALPPLLDLRWWGAVAPAQILLLAVLIPPRGQSPSSYCLAAQTLGAVAVTALTAPLGLTAVATAAVLWTALAAGVGLSPAGQPWGEAWRGVVRDAARPCLGAAGAGALLLVLAEPVGLRLAPLPALCLLTGIGWLVFLVIRGEPARPRRAAPSPVEAVSRT
ncbi:MAG TPA: oligosaccharide flippase family protein [Stellaceae bacterium]|nr:oligosaccharide flippase family protein [Stellaceae bacterium]